MGGEVWVAARFECMREEVSEFRTTGVVLRCNNGHVRQEKETANPASQVPSSNAEASQHIKHPKCLFSSKAMGVVQVSTWSHSLAHLVILHARRRRRQAAGRRQLQVGSLVKPPRPKLAGREVALQQGRREALMAQVLRPRQA